METTVKHYCNSLKMAENKTKSFLIQCERLIKSIKKTSIRHDSSKN